MQQARRAAALAAALIFSGSMHAQPSADRSNGPALHKRPHVTSSAAWRTLTPRAAGIALYQPLSIVSANGWRTLSIDLTPSAWRIGRPDGPPASEAELRSALADPAGLLVAGRCAHDLRRLGERPCILALAEPQFAGLVSKRVTGDALGWAATTGGARGAAERVRATPVGAGQMLAAFDSQRYFGLLAPAQYAGDAAEPFSLALRSRATSGEGLVPASFEPSTGSLVLLGRGREGSSLRQAALGEPEAQPQ